MTALAFLVALEVAAATTAFGVSSGPIDVRYDPMIGLWSIVPFREPSSAHPSGTIGVVGVDEEGETIVVEWDLATERELGRVHVAEDVADAVAVSNGGHIFVASAPSMNGAKGNVVLVELDESLRVVERRKLGVGERPSLAVSDRWLVAAFFEEREPMFQSMGHDLGPMIHAMHVVSIERASQAIVGAKVFLGPHMLMPPGDPAKAMHAVALRGDMIYLALPSAGEVTYESARLPSFSVVKERTIDGLGWFGMAQIEFRGENLETDLPTGTRRLSTDFVDRKLPIEPDVWTQALDGLSCQATVTAWSHPVTICQRTTIDAAGNEERGPARIYVRR